MDEISRYSNEDNVYPSVSCDSNFCDSYRDKVFVDNKKAKINSANGTLQSIQHQQSVIISGDNAFSNCDLPIQGNAETVYAESQYNPMNNYIKSKLCCSYSLCHCCFHTKSVKTGCDFTELLRFQLVHFRDFINKLFLKYRRFRNENILVLSTIQLLCGFAAIILSAVAFIKTAFLYQIATGLWTGILMLLTGLWGLLTSRKPVLCMLIALLILCSLVSLAACVLICVSVAGTIEDGFLFKNSNPNKSNIIVFRNKNFGLNILQKQDITIPSNHTNTAISLDHYTIHGSKKRTLVNVSDSYLHISQIILHLLLLLVGILETSVSLATAILCFRGIYSHSTNLRFHNSRANIVSFNAETANQAVSFLQSGAVNFVERGNVLLAIDSHIPLQVRAENCRRNTKPQIHHTLVPFLPQLNQNSLILTQAGSGSMALTAARATFNMLNTLSISSPVDSDNSVRSEVRKPRRDSWFRKILFKRNHGQSHSNNHRQRLHCTSFNLHSNRVPVPSSQNESISRQFSTVYVIPSPNREEPPMIFPPFPPSYDECKNESLNAVVSSSVSQNYEPIVTQASHVYSSDSRHRISRIYNRPIARTIRTRLRLWNNSNNLHTESRSRAVDPISAGDRLIQPVLIVNSSSYSDVFVPISSSQTSPPNYSQ